MMTRPVSRARWLAVVFAIGSIPLLAPLAMHVGADRNDGQQSGGRIAEILSCVLPASRNDARPVPPVAPAAPVGSGGCGAFPGSHPTVSWMTEC